MAVTIGPMDKVMAKVWEKLNDAADKEMRESRIQFARELSPEPKVGIYLMHVSEPVGIYRKSVERLELKVGIYDSISSYSHYRTPSVKERFNRWFWRLPEKSLPAIATEGLKFSQAHPGIKLAHQSLLIAGAVELIQAFKGQ